MHQKLLALEVAMRKNKVHQGWHVPTKMYVCAYNGYLTFLVKCIFFGLYYFCLVFREVDLMFRPIIVVLETKK